MPTIYTRKGEPIYVDRRDYARVKDYTWYIEKGVGYARATTEAGRFRMHRLILGIFDPKTKVDHWNGNRADNRRRNLRAGDQRLNMQNQTNKLRSDNKSGYRGVCWYEPRQKWHAQININGRKTHLGYFLTARAAAAAYRTAVTKYFR